MSIDSKIFVAGHLGMVGSAILRKLRADGYKNIVTASRKELDLLDQRQVQAFFSESGIEMVYLAAAKVGGIHSNNTYPASFIYENLQIQTNVIHAAHINDIQKLLFLGSSCIYPKQAPQPMTEDALLSGQLEPTNEPYAIAKIAGIKMCESYNRQYSRDYRSAMPTNLYGPNDNFHPENSHVLPALLRRFHEATRDAAKTVEIWGTGEPRREFLHVDDMAAASVHIAECPTQEYNQNRNKMCSHINVGTGIDCSIRELAEIISDVTNYKGDIQFDTSRPDGAQRKLLDVDNLEKLGWTAGIDLRKGIETTYNWYVENLSDARNR